MKAHRGRARTPTKHIRRLKTKASRSLVEPPTSEQQHEKIACITEATIVDLPIETALPLLSAQEHVMTLTFKSLSKNGKRALYSGLRTSVAINLTNFEGAPDEVLDIVGNFRGPRAKKAKLSKEERAALPKPTLAERVARANARAAKLSAKLAAQSASL